MTDVLEPGDWGDLALVGMGRYGTTPPGHSAPELSEMCMAGCADGGGNRNAQRPNAHATMSGNSYPQKAPRFSCAANRFKLATGTYSLSRPSSSPSPWTPAIIVGCALVPPRASLNRETWPYLWDTVVRGVPGLPDAGLGWAHRGASGCRRRTSATPSCNAGGERRRRFRRAALPPQHRASGSTPPHRRNRTSHGTCRGSSPPWPVP